jgi:hypothetical protein
MSTNIELRLEEKNSAEPIDSWESLCKDPSTFLNELTRRLIAVGNISFPGLVISDDVPPASDRGKVWIKTSWPYGIGKTIEGSYKMDYGMSGYPVGIPFLKEEIRPLKTGLSQLTPNQLNEYGIQNTSDNATKRMRWYIFNPPEIKF